MAKTLLWHLLPYRKLNAFKVTFFFSSMNNHDVHGIHDVLSSSLTEPLINTDAKTAVGDFLKEYFVADEITDALKKQGFTVIADKTKVEESEENEINLLSVLVIIVVAVVIYKLWF